MHLSLPFVLVALASAATSTLAATLSWDCTKIPNICSNDLYAIQCLGLPSSLHRDSSDATSHRSMNACRSPNRCAGSQDYGSCDEYPYASSAEGGAQAVTRCVPAHENSVQGGTLSSFYTRNDIEQGDQYNVAFYNTRGLEYADGSCDNSGDEVRRRQLHPRDLLRMNTAAYSRRVFNTAEGHELVMFEPLSQPKALDRVLGTDAYLATEARWVPIVNATM